MTASQRPVLLRALGAGSRLFVDGMMVVAAIIVPLMALAITFEVVMRYFFNASTIWAADAAAYSLLWMAFLAGPWLIRHEGHIRIDFLVERLSRRARAWLGAVTSLIGAAVMSVVLWQTLAATIEAYVRNSHMLGSWEIPRVLVWWVMPVGSLGMVIEFLRAAWLQAHGGRHADRELVPTGGEAGAV
jgi:TRAP-type C4-dicarboxylate transport system permease small subunit